MSTMTGVFSGLSQGLSQGYMDNYSQEGRANRAEAKARQKAGNLELERLNATAPTSEDHDQERENMRLQLQNNELQLRQQNNEMTRQQVFSAFDRYTGDYDIRHLNQGLRDAKKTEAGRALFGDTARVDRLSEADRELIKKAGLDPDLILNSETLLRQWVRTTDEDGDQSIQDMQQTFVMSGYERHAGNRELDRQIKAAQLHRDAASYPTATERQIARQLRTEGFEEGTPEFEEAFAAKYEEATRGDANRAGSTAREREALTILRTEGLTEGDDGFDERYAEVLAELRNDGGNRRNTQREQELNDRMAALGITEDDPEYAQKRIEILDQIIERERQTARGRDLDAVEEAKENIDSVAQERFGTDFFSLDFSNPANRRVFENDINRIEQQGGLRFDSRDRQELGYVKTLLELGEPGKELTNRETGIIDNLFRSVSRYITDETQGAEARAAYNGFRNLMRHSLYGSVQTEANIKAFNDEFGNLSQQRGPILAQFNNALRQLKGKLEGVQNLNDSYVVHYRIGADQTRLAEIIDNLEDEISRFNSLENQEREQSGSNVNVLDDEARQGLDAIMQEVGE